VSGRKRLFSQIKLTSCRDFVIEILSSGISVGAPVPGAGFLSGRNHAVGAKCLMLLGSSLVEISMVLPIA
jgi:hypothetical protein